MKITLRLIWENIIITKTLIHTQYYVEKYNTYIDIYEKNINTE